jgi:perosamine synthetase|tara:strand:- start:21 stop:1112 length:1092 start_codon:yes stop_codon:yes gene_type:complete
MIKNFKIPINSPNLGKEELKQIMKVYESNWPSEGPVTEKFETMLSKYLSSNSVVVNNGSSALMAAMIANEIKPGDTVIVPDFTFVATSSVAKILGAKVIVADVDPDTFNIKSEHVEEIIKKNDVKSVILVDVAGVPADIDVFTDLSKDYKFSLIEDAAQSFGSEYKNKKVGSFEHTTIFSFQIVKQITTIEGGCISTTNEDIIKKIRRIKDYGRSLHDRYLSESIGTNFRTTDLQSAIGIIQLKKIETHLKRRNEIASEYRKKIKQLKFQKIPKYVTKHSNQISFALAKNEQTRNIFVEGLNKIGIDSRKPWTPIHMQPCNPELSGFHCNNAVEIFKNSLALPLFNNMKLSEAKKVINYFNKI